MRDPGKVQPAGHGALKGRGAASYVSGRFEKTVAHAEDDGWGSLHADLVDEAGVMAPQGALF